MKEWEIQAAVVRWLRAREPRVLFCATMGGLHCSQTQRWKMWSQGYQKGVPDLVIYEPRDDHVGFAIEFKSARGYLRTSQQEWLGRLALRGWKTAVYRDPEEAISNISKYLGTTTIDESSDDEEDEHSSE